MTRVAKPTGPMKDHGREFALLNVMDSEGTGELSAETLMNWAKYGDEEKVHELAKAADVSFEQFASAFRKTGSAVHDGGGNCVGWAARDKSGKMAPWQFQRRELRPDDVHIQITYAGMCHSDVHTIRSEWGEASYPLVPGHEMIGVVVNTGTSVGAFKPGDTVGVGCMVHSCGSCDQCHRSEEQYCTGDGFVGTYGSKMPDGELTQGGYSTHIIVREAFVLRLPRKLHVPGAAPLLCAGITTYSPMRHYGIDKPGLKVGVLGLGGLGHMVVKFAKGFGQDVTVFSRSYKKKDDALRNLGADKFLATSDEDAVKEMLSSFDAIVDTVSAPHDINQLLSLLKPDGKLILLGAPPKPHEVNAFSIISKRAVIGGSLIGGIKETQEMLDFCAEHDITCQHEVIPADYVNEAVERMVAGDVKYRFVIDTLGTLIRPEE